jgi:predicted esterase
MKALQNTPVYLVVGSNDPILPVGYMKKNYDTLRASNIDAHYYEEPGGLHAVGTIKNAFGRAWRDMLGRSNSATPAPAVVPPSTPRPQKP